jgi:hypothetical protein
MELLLRRSWKMAMLFWAIGAGLFAVAVVLVALGGTETGGIIDYRAWILFALGMLALVIGNSRWGSGHGK